MKTQDALLHDANRAAHKVARAALVQSQCAAEYRKTETISWRRQAGDNYAKATVALRRALHEYEQADRRAQMEATS